MIQIEREQCIGCGACQEVCASHAIALLEDESGSYANVDQERCTECGACLEVCPQGAIYALETTSQGHQVITVAPKVIAVRPAKAQGIALAPVARGPGWMGAALAFVAREVAPRVAMLFLDVLERRGGETRSPSTPSRIAPSAPAARPTQTSGSRGRRHRRHRGGR